MKHINRGPFLSHEVALPPLNEQRRIVDKLERIGDRHRTARNELNHIPKLIARYKQAVLTAATSGEDSEDWENVDIQSVAKVGTGSTPLKSNSGYYADTGTPWITSAATSQPFVSKASGFVTDSAISDCRLKKYPVGTILVAMYGEGKTRGQVTELAIEATINQACAAIMVDESLACKEYVKLSLQANYLEMRELAEGGNQPNLNLSKIKTFPLFLPPLEEQEEIVRRVEKMFEKIDMMEEEYQKAAKLCDRLEQATLAKAFRGELVPQDPHDEPASVLLEQVKSQKEKGKKGK
jgi:type I restriction enzyme S subunit